MPERSLLALWFLIGGGALALVGLVLWKVLAIPMDFPPYLATAALMLGYGAFCLNRSRRGGGGKT